MSDAQQWLLSVKQTRTLFLHVFVHMIGMTVVRLFILPISMNNKSSDISQIVNIVKHDRQAPEMPRKDPAILLQTSGEKYFQTLFSHPRANLFYQG